MKSISTPQLMTWIRTRETEAMMAASGSREQVEAQKQIDYLCKELGRRGEN